MKNLIDTLGIGCIAFINVCLILISQYTRKIRIINAEGKYVESGRHNDLWPIFLKIPTEASDELQKIYKKRNQFVMLFFVTFFITFIVIYFILKLRK
jgi:hypothetical protein